MIPRLHVVTDDEVLAAPGFVSRARAVMESGRGAAALHLRGPHTPARRLWELGFSLCDQAVALGVPLVVNDRVGLALALGASGAHLGTRSLPPAEARKILGPRALVGASVHNAEEARAIVGRLDLPGPDFAFVGPLFPTPSHPKIETSGTRLIQTVGRELRGIPLLGIGGISAGRVAEVLEAGAYGVAVVRAVWEAADPIEAVAELLDRLASTRRRAVGGGVKA